MQDSPVFNLRMYAHQMSEELDRYAKRLHQRDVTMFVTHAYYNDTRAATTNHLSSNESSNEIIDSETEHLIESSGNMQYSDPDIKIEPVSVMEENDQ